MPSFADELARFGPHCPRPDLSIPFARAYCAAVARSHYENFAVVSLLLPRRLRGPFQAVYAWCRWADDLADETGPNAPELLRWWDEELTRCYANTPTHPVTIALAPVVRKYHIPAEPFRDLLSAFVQDQTVKCYQTFAELCDYCRRSANPVGRLVLHLWQSATPENVIWSDAICTALQLANFWQDVSRDRFDLGRTYLPAEDMAQFGYQGEAQATPEFRELLRFEVTRTQALFDTGTPLLGAVPRGVRTDLELFIAGGRAILDEIVQQDYDVWTRRPTVSKAAKLRLVLRAVWGRVVGRQ